ncbi:STAS/SEC14 domain-containing protein [Bernardetia sp. MNP-M8]|uniref:STAS/SEC14 domain-containing protein n=1 Tax=Bernardetia sp. MNP-M8 TaxID=3127470 RepID=UPI0030CB2755
MIIYESVFSRLEFFKDDNFIEATWFATTEDMTPEQYKEAMTNYLKFALEFKPKRALVNLQNFLFTVSPTLQEWTESTMAKSLLKLGWKEMAMVVSPEFISQLSVEQLMEEKLHQNFTTKYFPTKEEARKWIMSLSDSKSV